MLSEITIENVAVIEKASAVFTGGFTVLTGETGAGKSILIDSINAILGNRASRDIVRGGAQKAAIWAVFADVPPPVREKLSKAGFAYEGELLIQRELGADGKSGCRINGMPATAAMLREVCADLVNIHGQHDNQALMNPARHTEVLDAFAGHGPLLASYSEAYKRWMELKGQIASLSVSEGEKSRKTDLLRHEIEEIEAAALSAGEDSALAERRNTVVHAQRILEGLNNAYLALSGGDDGTGAVTLLSDAAAHLADAAEYAPELSAFSASLSEMYYSANEAASDIGERLADFEFDGQSLDGIERRLDLIYRLKQKYGPALADVISYCEKARAALERITFSAQKLESLKFLAAQAENEAQGLAAALTKGRMAAFSRLNGEIVDTLSFLNMPGITFRLSAGKAGLGPSGCDELEFLISTNPGEAPKPLAKIASGGELARIMLALKGALADRDEVSTVIYDEIDTGVSGQAAGRIAQVLAATAAGRQVICVTHTAQIAAFAQRHLLIEKTVENGRAFTRIRELNETEREEELARIISGDNPSQTARANAREMLLAARGAAEKE